MRIKLPAYSQEIFENVKKAMQDAEEIGGPEGDDYMNLMQAIIEEANERQVAYFHMLNPRASRGRRTVSIKPPRALRGFLR